MGTEVLKMANWLNAPRFEAGSGMAATEAGIRRTQPAQRPLRAAGRRTGMWLTHRR